MARLKQGDVFEVIIDKYQNKGYLIYLAKHIPIGFKMFGLYAVKPTVQGCSIKEIENGKIISTIMIFEDKIWRKIGKLNIKDFVWPDQYERDLDDNNKYIIYHWGDGEDKRIIKAVEKESDLGLAQIGSTFFPAGALKFYRDKLRELGLYNIPEEENIDANNKQDDFDGLYGDVYYSAKKTLANTKMNILKKKGSIVQKVKLDKADSKYLNVVTMDDLGVVEEIGNKNKYKYSVSLDDVSFPIYKGQVVGKIDAIYKGKVVSSTQLISKSDVNKINIFKLIGENIISFVNGF